MLRSAVVISGASKGFGSAVAKAFAKSGTPDMHFVLSGRNQQDLRETEREILQIRNNLGLSTTCNTVVGDIENTSQLERLAEELFGECAHCTDNTNGDLSTITFVNNAGSLGPLVPVGSSDMNLAEMIANVNLNVTGCLYLTSEFVRRFKESASLAECPKAVVVNVSSLAAVQAFPTWGMYCACKAARDMYHTVLAEEQRSQTSHTSQNPANTTSGAAGVPKKEIIVLSYAPGPMDTNMQAQIRASEQSDPSLGSVYTDMKAQNLLVDPLTSAEKLVAILNTPNNFRSGAHVDYYDNISLY